MKYREAYLRGTEFLLQIHGDSEEGQREAGLESRLLLEKVCLTRMQDLLLSPDRILTEGEEQIFETLLQKRLARIPTAYLLGEQEFMGLSFEVSQAVLIPRQDTENLVEEALREITDGSRVLDLCTGSGCILLSILRYTNGCTGIGTDLSPEALEVARRNAQKLGLDDRADFRCGDLFAPVAGMEGTFDLITANPPYIRTAEMLNLQPEVRIHEPALALDGGDDGLGFYRRIAAEAARFLNLGGLLMMEIGFDQAEDVIEILRNYCYYSPEVYKDYGGKDRVVRAFRGTHTLC